MAAETHYKISPRWTKPSCLLGMQPGYHYCITWCRDGEYAHLVTVHRADGLGRDAQGAGSTSGKRSSLMKTEMHRRWEADVAGTAPDSLQPPHSD